ncbi:PREDICTED: uncharacterized protein LOC106741985 [Dinoponera quadriceps]|uniref:Uncharacterized protein LOC106741985 n=1 Tax=Dinoponera quadriceps TaxID=609295 RepID=A0A6P3WV33_DINQU|nr:PREDICTED: uncharacterized protein LOC106741985 [Dinoponera quadriceps]XP_014469976.1 PREDICTED: uncharacterized protein LOC106741985 [Dinoponera quadriceps]XP_014469977.1 PREDICTED: uncharacterized protein LOC106741985 [Dinoponera quadriceps]XP_014469978.1 PREDICTED: uncharacterized protein LOC106741985 [Dinoponera quadriceps]XP_014469979.1 PREDICTED: uncharacterized protein LOC106741985 [Dinoponera quadriceps]
MDVSFTNVLEGARQYFQGLPVPSTGGGAASVDHSLATSASSTSATTHDHGASSQPMAAASASGGSGNGIQESSRYPTDVRPSSVEGGATSSSAFWNPHVEPYPPQPTKVEVPDTRPGDEGAAMEPSSSSSVTLTEMQPSNHQSSSSSSSATASSNFSQRPPTSSASSSGEHHHPPSSTQHMQPPHSPGPVYQQLNNVSRTSFTAAEMLASSHTPTYQTANDRQSQPIVAQRTQYYPRYHHPDITKSAPAPFSQSSIYQSANVALASTSAIQQPSTRPTPVEQSNAQSHCAPERLPGTYGNVPPSQSPLGGSAVYDSSSSSSSSSSSQSYRMGQHHQSIRLAASASVSDRSQHSSVAASSSSSSSYISSPICTTNPSVSTRQLGGSSSGHIPSSQNLPGHIPSSHHHPQQHQPSHMHHPSRINPSYGGRSLPHGGASSVPAAGHSQMPPPSTNLSGYHAAPSPPHRQSHTGFQPHSPTYPPPPNRSTSSSTYNLPASSQHYQPPTAYGSNNPYAPPPSPSSYHSFQKTPAQPTSYYSQPSRSYGMQQMLPQTAYPAGSNYQQGKHAATYNGADAKRSAMDAPYGTTHRSAVQRSGNTHNLPPIAALSSYHSNRSREPVGAKSAQRQRAKMVSSIAMHPQRVAPTVMIPVNGRTTTVTNLSYGSRYAGQQSYPSYATTMAPSHHGSNSTSSTTVTSIGGGTARSSVPAGGIHAYQSSDETDRSAGASSYHHHQPSARTTEGGYAYKEYPPYQSTTSSSSGQQPGPTMASSPSSSGSAVRKRESPLDLSVKTVKTSADSTAQDDLEATSTDKHVSSSNVSRSMPPPQPLYPSSYDSRPSSNGSSVRNSITCVRTSTPQAVCAPKVDFLPDFNSAPLRHQAQPPHEHAVLRRSAAQQQLYVPPPSQPSHHANNTAPLPHMSTFKKRPLPTTQMYDSLSIAPPPPSSSSSSSTSSTSSSSYLQPNDSMPSRFSKYPPMVDPSRVGSAALPAQDYPHDPAKYYLDNKSKLGQQYLQRERGPFKRLGEPLYPGPSKQPRLAWPVTADKPIEQKLSTTSALNEQQKRQEVSLPAPNGALMTPAAYEQRPDSGYSTPESSRYQQAYCDKRNYPDSKIVRSSPTYSHPVISKPSSAPQHLTTAQPTYSSYRQAQKTTCPPVGTSGGQPMDQPSNTGADKRVLNLLRNSLENKQQREEQLNSQQPILVNHSQQSFQNKVVAPVEPKTNIGRHNLSPFTAANLLERNSNTPPHYKFHMPRAVDSITQEAAPRSLYGSKLNASATLPGKEALLGPRGAENQIHRDKDDGLAAMLAAKIRTKAELKQVGTGHFATKAPLLPPQDASPTPKATDSAASTSTPQSGSSAGSPPKLTREKTTCLPPRRRLFSRTEDDNMPVAATVPAAAPAAANTGTVASAVPARASGCRSSSETSVFDFRESDSEGEMPVLERQTLEEMRRDRKQLSKVQPPIPLNDAVCMNTSTDLVKIELKENDKINEVDPFWTTTCDKFMEQLRKRDVKKRTRTQNLSGNASSKPEDTAVDSDRDSDTNASSLAQIRPENIKKEEPFGELSAEDKSSEAKIEEAGDSVFKIKTEPELSKDDDSDEVPLIKRATRHKSIKKEDSDGDEEVICRKRRVRRGSRIKLVSSSGSESSSEDSDGSTEFGRGSSVADRLRARKRSMNNTFENEGMKLRSRDATPHKAGNTEKEPTKLSPPKGGPSSKRKPKPLFGDGSDFRPGWEEEVYVYKKSLRMPTRLITVSKPSRFHRLSTSLPDLDPGSPALSVSMDSSDVCLSRKKLIDSDMESNYSFGIAGKIDDEEATSSTTVSCPPKAMKHSRSENSSIVDVLAQKVGSDKIDSKRKLSPKGSKVLNKSSNEPELLPTPSLGPTLSSVTSKRNKSPLKNHKSMLRVTDSNLLGYFRKETVNNFREAFKNNHTLPNEFSTLVLKSRTRTETKVMKKEATIREVFGEDRPASAPPMQNRDDTSQDDDDDSQNETLGSTLGKARTLKQRLVSRLKNTSIQRSRKAIVNKAMAERRKDLLKSIADKTLRRIKLEEEETVQDETNDAREEENNEMEDDKNDPEAPGKKRLKLRTSRRKFRSGFDYIRKKKKPMKRDETLPKEKKRQVLPRPNPECVGDIQSEIRTWVIKKGVGETILHRAARLGYTDVAAYCLEKLNNIASPKDNAGYTPLHEACSKGHLEIAKLLLAYGANVSESANGGIRPLHEAAENGATELVRLLLSYGADPLLATYSGQTPLTLAVDTEAHSILEQHLDDVQGRATVPWSFPVTSSAVDSEETGCNSLDEAPLGSPEPSLDDVEMEVSDINLPALFILKNDSDKWVLLHDLMAILKVKSRDALLRQINPKAHSGPPTVAHREVMRELKLPDFLEQTRCCHLLSGGEKINVRGSKVTLIKYNDKVKSLLNVEKVLISLR